MLFEIEEVFHDSTFFQKPLIKKAMHKQPMRYIGEIGSRVSCLESKWPKLPENPFFMVLKFGFHRANLSRSAALKLNIELSLFVSQFNYRPSRG